MGILKTALNPSRRPGNLAGANGANVSDQLLEKARADADTVLKELGSQLDGLSEAEADSRLKRYGPNDIAQERRQSPFICFLGSSVESGSATAVVVRIGDKTYFGSLAASIVGQRVLTSVDKSINQFTWLMIRGNRPCLIVKAREVYSTPRSLNMRSMTAMTISV